MAEVQFLNIGYGAHVALGKIVAIVHPDSAPIRRLIRRAREEGRLVDATYGRRTRAVIVMEGGIIVLSAVLPETLVSRGEEWDEDEEEEKDDRGSD